MRVLHALKMPRWWVVLWVVWAVSEALRWRHGWLLTDLSNRSLALDQSWFVASWSGFGALAFAATRLEWHRAVASDGPFPLRPVWVIAVWLCVPALGGFAGVGWLAGWGPSTAAHIGECAIALGLVSTAAIAVGGWAATQRTWGRSVVFAAGFLLFASAACFFGLITQFNPERVRQLTTISAGSANVHDLAKPAHVFALLWPLLIGAALAAWRSRRWSNPSVVASAVATVTGLFAALVADNVRPEDQAVALLVSERLEVLPFSQIVSSALISKASSDNEGSHARRMWKWQARGVPTEWGGIEPEESFTARLLPKPKGWMPGAGTLKPDLSLLEQSFSADPTWMPPADAAFKAIVSFTCLKWEPVADIPLEAGASTHSGRARTKVLEVTPVGKGTQVQLHISTWQPSVAFLPRPCPSWHNAESYKIVHVSPAGKQTTLEASSIHWWPTAQFAHFPLTLTLRKTPPERAGSIRVFVSTSHQVQMTYELRPEVSLKPHQ